MLLACLEVLKSAGLFSQQPLDSRELIFHDQLLDNLIGDWKLTRKFKTRTVENTVKAEWTG